MRGTTSQDRLRPARMPLTDRLRVGVVGLRTRPLRAVLSALGIALGVAAMVSVVGVSASGQAKVERTLDALGTNLLVARTGGQNQSTGQAGHGLDPAAVQLARRIGPVESAAGVGRLPDSVHVYRNDHVPAEQTSGILVYSADPGLPQVVGATIERGSWFSAAALNYPTVVLGHEAALRLGITRTGAGVLVELGGRRFSVIGILDPITLASELDSAALIGSSAGKRYLAAAGLLTAVYVRAADPQVSAVRDVLAATVEPSAPYEVDVSRPSDALAAKLVTEQAFNGLLIGLGGVALLVGAVGVANTMIISVLERRAEIGLRRALGATRGSIRSQFLLESLLLALLGGVAGVVLGAAATIGYAVIQRWPVVIPLWAIAGGALATIVVGALAGMYPAIRASRLSPTDALASG